LRREEIENAVALYKALGGGAGDIGLSSRAGPNEVGANEVGVSGARPIQ
jgi:hypothetical protein